MDIQKALGQAIKKVRIKKGFSQEYFSDVSSRTYLSVLEHGKKKPSVEKIESLANAMGVHPLTILTLAYLNIDDSLNLSTLQQIVLHEITEINANAD